MSFLIDNGWICGVKHKPSPNFNMRPIAQNIKLIVIHHISLPPDQFGHNYICDFFLNQLDSTKHPYFEEIKNMQVSAHILILRTGEIIQFVSLEHRAWHAGVSTYLGQPNCNDYSIGIELEGCDSQPFETAQYEKLCLVVTAIQQFYPQTQGHIAGHSDIAKGRKTDPGLFFEWRQFRQQLHTLVKSV